MRSSSSDDDFNGSDGFNSDFDSSDEMMVEEDEEMSDVEEVDDAIPQEYLLEVNDIYRTACFRLNAFLAAPSIRIPEGYERTKDADGYDQITLKKANLINFPLGIFKTGFKSIRTIICNFIYYIILIFIYLIIIILFIYI